MSNRSEWSRRQFCEIARIGSGQVSPTETPYADYYCLGPEDIESDSGKILSLRTAREQGMTSGKYLFDAQAIVYSKIRPNLNKVCLPGFTGICSADMYPIWPEDDVVDARFLLQYMLSDCFLGQTIPVSMRTGMPKINREDLCRLWIDVPPLPEQRKIAEILSTWDEALALLDRRIELAAQRKQGLMQRLLTGRVRFAEFVRSQKRQQTNFGDLPADWRYVPIGRIAREVSDRHGDGGELPVLSCTKHHGLVDSLEYFGRQIYSDDLSSYKVVRERQFAYATNHIEEGSIGYQDLHDAALISPMYTVFETTDEVEDAFLYRVLKTEKYRHIFEINTNGTVNRRGSLRWQQFAHIRVPVPSLPEQRRIAEVLDTCDREIELLQRKRELLRQQKKGLMQRLLTGRVRVRV